jgi:1-acyl-sn-glycerol-3-phosphate acyltransferase
MTERRRGRGHLWIAYEYVAMVAGLGFLALICLLWLPFAMILHPLLPRRWGQPFGRFFIMSAFRVYLAFLTLICACRVDLSSLDNLRHEGPLIVVANHPSLLDAVLVLSHLPNAVCVMKAELMDNILFGAAARLARYIRNDAAFNLLFNAREELRRGTQLVIFPEGSRTKKFPVDPFLPTAAVIARRTGIPVQTLLITFSSPYLGKGWPLFRKPDLPLEICVRLGRRFPAQKDIGAFSVQLEEYFRAELGTFGASTATGATAS